MAHHASLAARVAALAVLATLASAPLARLSAQAPAAGDSLPFARGQWGVQVTGGTDLVGVGALRFTSPRTAWLLELTANAGYSKSRSDGGFPPPGGASQSVTAGGAGLRIGRRGYRPLGPSVASFATAGVSASYGAARQKNDEFTSRTQAVSGGVFGDLGATYLVTPHLGLGASVTLAADYVHSRNKYSDVSSKADGFFIRLGSPVALVTLFF